MLAVTSQVRRCLGLRVDVVMRLGIRAELWGARLSDGTGATGSCAAAGVSDVSSVSDSGADP